jgi:apolipoprotein D and lipocalin family protein
MRCLLFAITLAWGTAAGAAAPAGNQAPPRPVERVDLERYAGRWYEIARVPNWFQAGCARGTRATYTLGPDGRIEVVNRCLRADGSENEARGLARVVDPATNARLEVSFVRFLGKSFFWGDYWVLGLGDDYEYAIVGTPDRKFGWVLARTPTLEPDVRVAIDAALSAQGYDPNKFEPSAP